MRPARLLALALAVGACLVGCAVTSSPNPSPGGPRSPVDGVVTSIDSSGLAKVNGFSLRTNTGQTYTFVIGQLENGAQFPPGHLAEHQATALPIRVWFTDEAGRLVVYRLEDAPLT